MDDCLTNDIATADRLQTLRCSHFVIFNIQQAIFIGEGEFREEKYEELGEFRFDLPFSSYDFPETTPDVEGHCVYTFSVYPTVSPETVYHQNGPRFVRQNFSMPYLQCTFQKIGSQNMKTRTGRPFL